MKAKERLLSTINSLSDLKTVEDLIRSKFQSDAHLLSEIPSYLLALGGKRIRPTLTLLVAEAFGVKNEPNSAELKQQIIDVAAGIELIHMATLMHDDIIDKSPLRRHQKTPYVKYGLANTLLAGDFLLVRAFRLCSHLDPFVISATEQACVELTEGEILETPLYKDQHSLESSLNIAKKKTAALFRLAAQAAGHISTHNDDITKALADFGEKLGIAFQVLDDILDVTSDEKTMGKSAGIDIIEKKPSVINVLWLQSSSKLSQRLLNPPCEDDHKDLKEALLEVQESETVNQAKEIALNYASEAKAELSKAISLASEVNQERVRDIEAIVEYTVERLE